MFGNFRVFTFETSMKVIMVRMFPVMITNKDDPGEHVKGSIPKCLQKLSK